MTFDVPENEAIPAGLYPAVLVNVSTKTLEKGQYAGDTIRIWTFAVDYQGETKKVDGSSSLAFGPASKSYEWFMALMGRPPVFGEKNVQIAGRPCTLNLTVNDNGYNRVKDVLPPTGPQKAAAPAPAAPTPLVDDGPPLEEPPMLDADGLPF